MASVPPRPELAWHKSMQSGLSNCVEVAQLSEGGVAVRDSKNPSAPALHYTAEEWEAFAAGMKSGEFDYLLEKEITPGTHHSGERISIARRWLEQPNRERAADDVRATAGS
jgi:hypothetical protein